MDQQLKDPSISTATCRNIVLAGLLATTAGHRGVALREMRAKEWKEGRTLQDSSWTEHVVTITNQKVSKSYGATKVVVTGRMIKAFNGTSFMSTPLFGHAKPR